jgi:hypothetical protein
MGDDFVLTVLTDDPELAESADLAGIDRIGIDLEKLGKERRQVGWGTRISDHEIESLAAIRPRLKRASLFARCNPIHAHSAAEVDALLEERVQVIMLPYFKTLRELEVFTDLVRGRAQIVPLVETVEALDMVGRLRRDFEIGEFHFGLNDLQIQMGLDDFWAVLESRPLRDAARAAQESGIFFGVGGVARPDDDQLPYPPTRVYQRLMELGANGAWLSRSFFRQHFSTEQFVKDVAELRAALERARRRVAERSVPDTSSGKTGPASKADLVQKLLAWGAGNFDHVNGSLIRHLTGTHDLLKAWSNREALCNAGLFHTAYGTAGYEPALAEMTDRPAVASLIGEEAEHIVYLFAACDRKYFYRQIEASDDPQYRDRFSHKAFHLSPQELSDFCELTMANEIEIELNSPAPGRVLDRHLKKVLSRMAAHVSAAARLEYARVAIPVTTRD